jgi:serine/threonine-protein kinase RsbW
MKALRVEGTLQAIEPVVQYAMQAAEKAGFESRDLYRVRLAVDELATNIVTHGYLEAGRSGDLTISAEVLDDQLTIYLEDKAESHDPRETPPPDLSAPITERPVGGLGVYLALWAIDGFDYEQDEDGNRSILVMERPSCPKQANQDNPTA